MTHQPHIRGLADLAHVWLIRRSALHQQALAHGQLYFLPRDASAERGNAIVSRPSVRL